MRHTILLSYHIGYLFAALGPLLFGILHDMTGEWYASLAILLITAIGLTLFGSQAGRNRTIEQSLKK